MSTFQFGAQSAKRLATCDPALEAVARLALANSTALDMTCTCGHRDKAAQDDAVARGCSKVRWPNSNHNKFPSLAMDLEPYPINYNDESRYVAVSKLVKAAADVLGVKLTWGGDWKGGWDKPHYELAAPSGWTRDESGKPIPPKSATGGAAASSGTAGASSAPVGCAAACSQNLDEVIDFNSTRFGVPASIIQAMIQVESSGKADATRYEPAFFKRYVDGRGFDERDGKGRATSWGLMQIMGEVAREMGFRGEFEELFDPAVNLEWCCRLLGRIKGCVYDSFGWPAVCAAYNGGLGAVRGKDNFTNPQYPAKVLKALGGVWPE